MARILSMPRRLIVAIVLLFALGLAVPAALMAQDVQQMSNDQQKDWLTQFVQDRLSTPERQISLSNIDGILGSNVSIREITISDQQGVWLRVNNATLTWSQAALFLGRLEVQSLKADSIDYLRNAVPAEGTVDLPSAEAGGFQIPQFPVAIILQDLAIPKVTFGENVFGLGSEISLAGSFTLQDGNLSTKLDVVRLDGPGGTLDLDLAYTGSDNAIDLGLALVEPADGVIANLLSLDGRPAVNLTIAGKGPVADLRTDLTLQANGQTALTGVATINQQAEGFAVAAQLGGPLSTLVAAPYRPFFGADTSLTANALVRTGGGLSITGLKLSGGQLSLDASAETTPDNFLRQLVVNAVVADPTGGVVTLPVPGDATSVGNAKFAINFGAEGSENWTSTLAIDGFKTDGFASKSLLLNLGGVAENLSDPATRRLTFNGDGTLSGIVSSPEVEAALGPSIGLGIAGLWNAGQPVELAQFRVVGNALTAALSGQLNGLDFDGKIALDTSSISPFSGLAGRPLKGGLSLAATGKIMPLSGGFDLALDGKGTNLSIGEELADDLLTGTVNLSGSVSRTTTGLAANNFRIANNQVQMRADGTYSSSVADFTFNLDLIDLALLSDAASGPLKVVGTAKGQDNVIDLNLNATLANGSLVKRTLRNGSVGFAGRYNVDRLDGTITGAGELDGFRTTLAGNVAVDSATQALSNLDFQAAGARITGGVTRTAATGLLDGGLDVVAPDVSVAAALALMQASGAVNAQLALAPATDGTQGATLRGDVNGLKVNDISVGSADINASIGDLFGVPMVNGVANAKNVQAAGTVINTLTAKASQSGETTSFDAQAALAQGTNIDVAGSLTPIAEGYRLALSRAQLAQGQLSAALAQPTELTVSGSNVSLDAVRFNVGSGSVTASGTAGDALNLTVDISKLPLSIANTVAPDLALAGTLDGRAVITGTGADPRVQFEARAGGISAAAIADFGITPLNVTANGSFANNTVSLAALSANGAGGLTLSGSGTVPLAGNGLNVTVTGSAPLALGNRFVADRGGQLSGTVNLDARVSGSIGAPQFGGTVTTSGSGYIDPELNLRLQNISGSASLSGEQMTVNNLSANLATGGTVSVAGTIGLSNGIPANLRVSLNGARYADGDLFVATLSGGLTLTGPITGSPLLKGDVLVQEANITVPDGFGGGATLIDVDHIRTPRAVQQTLQRARIDAAGAPVPQTRPSGVVLDINVNAPNQIFIRGRGLDAEVGGSVRLTGPLNDIQPVGGFALNRGRLAILGQRVTFDSGTVTLVGDLDPQINFVARTEGEGITVFVTVSGRASDIDVSFTSSPALPQDEVLSRLIFNRAIGDLSPLQLAKLAAAAAELAGGGGNNNLVGSLRDAAGLDDLDIVTDKDGNVAVQAGAYIQDNVYLGVQAGANGQSKVTINLDVTNDIKVTGGASQDGNSSLGVNYEKDY